MADKLRRHAGIPSDVHIVVGVEATGGDARHLDQDHHDRDVMRGDRTIEIGGPKSRDASMRCFWFPMLASTVSINEIGRAAANIRARASHRPP